MSNLSPAPPIFIIGSGRSGTTLLLSLFADHPEVFAPKIETRFLVDFGGLIDLIDALTTHYSPARAREALYRFDRLMTVDLVSPRHRPYAGINLAKWFGQHYYTSLQEFYTAITHYEFRGLDHPIPGYDSVIIRFARFIDTFYKRLRGKWLPSPGDNPRRMIREPRYYSDRSQLVVLARKYLVDLFETASQKSGKSFWCEKTPHHLFHVEFLLELFPDAKFIHAVRDPRNVTRSLTKQVWAPTNPEHAAILLADIYEAWFVRKKALKLNDRNYLEIKYEDLVSEPESTLDTIGRFCGLTKNFDAAKVISSDVLDHQRVSFSIDETDRVTGILKKYIERLGYK